MPYCPKCGNNVDETMVFCPNCGTALKDATPSPAAPNREKEEKQEKHENPEKGEYGFVRFLMGGLILITVGVFAILDLTSNGSAAGQDFVIMLILIGIIIIIGALYVTAPVRKFFRQLISRPKKEPAKT